MTMLTFLVKNGKIKLSGESIFWEYAKSNLVLVVVLVLESKGLHYQKLDQKSNSPTYILQCTNLGIYGFSPHEFNEN